LQFTFQETSYFDYLKSGEILDFPYPNSDITYREKFGKSIEPDKGVVSPFENLTNIVGVGVFIITNDNFVITSEAF